jgi:hypothetical protein
MKEIIKIKIIIDISPTILKEILNPQRTNHIIQLIIKQINFIKTEKEMNIKKMTIEIIMKEEMIKIMSLLDSILVEIDLFK